jgi:hypothetical protein
MSPATSPATHEAEADILLACSCSGLKLVVQHRECSKDANFCNEGVSLRSVSHD